MTILKKGGRWQVQVRPSGKNGPFIRRWVNSRSEAVRLERELLGLNLKSLDTAMVSVLIDVWYDFFGISLADGVRRKAKLLHMVRVMGDCRFSSFHPSRYLNHRKTRLNQGIAPNTCNHELAYLKAVFSKLHKSGQLSSNPLAVVAPLKLHQSELAYLTSRQILRLLASAKRSRNESLPYVIWLCLCTGARWGEAEGITFSQLGYSSVTYTKTKSYKSRTVPVDRDFMVLLKRRRNCGQDRVFANCLSAFRAAVKRARIDLPKGQMSHVLRHTYASHFMMNGGDILTLQRILGHSDINLTMRYSHLAPDHLRGAVQYRPFGTCAKLIKE